MSKRTLKGLFKSREEHTYLHISPIEVWDDFVKQCEAEGLTWADGRKLSEVDRDDVVALTDNMTFCYIGICGRIAIQCRPGNLKYIDYQKYVNGNISYSA